MPKQISLRHGTADQWTAANPLLAAGEPGLETDTGKWKFGDGTKVWTALSYTGAGDLTGKLDVGGKAADSSKINGVSVSGAPTAGQIPVATNATTAPWTDPPFPTKAAATGTAAGLSIVFGG